MMVMVDMVKVALNTITDCCLTLSEYYFTAILENMTITNKTLCK